MWLSKQCICFVSRIVLTRRSKISGLRYATGNIPSRSLSIYSPDTTEAKSSFAEKECSVSGKSATGLLCSFINLRMLHVAGIA